MIMFEIKCVLFFIKTHLFKTFDWCNYSYTSYKNQLTNDDEFTQMSEKISFVLSVNIIYY